MLIDGQPDELSGGRLQFFVHELKGLVKYLNYNDLISIFRMYISKIVKMKTSFKLPYE